MTTHYFVLTLFLAAFGLSFLGGYKYSKPNADGGWMGLCILSGIAALVLGAIGSLNYFVPHYDARQCARYGQQAEREVKFKRFSYWTWTCYVKTKSGNWVEKEQIRGVDQ